MRWNDACTLVASPERYQDAEGHWRKGAADGLCVFCNDYSVGLSAWQTVADLGRRLDARLQVRTADYSGQPEVEWRGERYSVISTTESGDLTVLSLERKVGNGV